MPNSSVELRCDNKLHGLIDGGLIEIKCDSRFCGAGQGWTVLHRFDATTGEFIVTERFKSPPTPHQERMKQW